MSVLQIASFSAEIFFDLSICPFFVTVPMANLPIFNQLFDFPNQTQPE